MKIVVTGAGGFVGSAVVDALVRHGGHDITAVDVTLDRVPGSATVDYVEGNIADPDVRARALATGCDALVHLATVPGGAAEENSELALQVNLDASIALIDEATQKASPKIVFASSIAVFGDADLAIVDHRTLIAPKLIYGAHKAMSGFGCWPALDSSRATSQGFRADRDLRSLVNSVIYDIRSHGGFL